MWNAFELLIRTLGRWRLIGWLVALSVPASTVAPDPLTVADPMAVVHVDIDLVVTDRQGRPVTDLDPQDLALFSNGNEHEILYLDPHSRQEAGFPAHRAKRQRHLVIYADNLRIWPKRRNALLRRLNGFIEQRVDRGDRVSVVGFDGSIELLAQGARDVDAVRTALEMLASRPTHIARVASEARQLRLALLEGPDASSLRSSIQGHLERQRFDAIRSVAGLTKTIELIARPEQSTDILYLSGGIPAWPGDDLSRLALGESQLRIAVRSGVDDSTESGVPTPSIQYLASLPRSRSGPDQLPTIESTTPFLEPLIRVANAHNVAFYPVHPAPSLHTSLTGSRIPARKQADHIEPLRILAQSTGGDLIAKVRFENALVGLSRRLDSTYRLGFQVSVHRGETESHRLEVQLAHKGQKAHYRRSCTVEAQGMRPKAVLSTTGNTDGVTSAIEAARGPQTSVGHRKP